MALLSTAELLATVLDPDSWRPWDAPLEQPAATPEYQAELAEAQTATGSDESVTTGSGRLAGAPVAVVAGDFEFLAGSVGQAAAARIIAGFDRATALGLPVLGLPTSGGTRMQEGTPAFLQMAGIAGAVRAHTDAGLPYLVYLRHPTTGGVFATWGSLGDVTFGQPGALTGFLGPRVYEGLYGHPFPDGVQTSAGLAAAGVIDGVATPEQWAEVVRRVLAVWRGRPESASSPPGWEISNPDVSTPPTAPAPEHVEPAAASAWDCVVRTRRPDRPGAQELLSRVADRQPLSGTGQGERAHATLLELGSIDGIGCVIVAQDRSAQRDRAAEDPALGIGPADLRLARRGMALAQRWGLPLLTIIDTQGAELSEAAESGALGGEIARCLAELSALRTPTMSVLLGGGGGGAALALLPADRVIAANDSWVSPLPVEGASLIRYRTVGRAAEMAAAQSIRAADLAAVGGVDRIVTAPVDDGDAWLAVLGEELTRLVTAGSGAVPRQWPVIRDR